MAGHCLTHEEWTYFGCGLYFIHFSMNKGVAVSEVQRTYVHFQRCWHISD